MMRPQLARKQFRETFRQEVSTSSLYLIRISVWKSVNDRLKVWASHKSDTLITYEFQLTQLPLFSSKKTRGEV